MIETPTLFILGAGASKPYGYPTGLELRAGIVKKFNSQLRFLFNKEPEMENPGRQLGLGTSGVAQILRRK